ncbi:MAG TPA: hypothetical protein VEY32_06880 [Flavisolibacter sp.]|nr:hypothetical protein [Flavisolibacter sp.]
MSKIFSTNVFVRGHMAFYDISSSNEAVYYLSLKICKLKNDPPPTLIRIHQSEGKWKSLDSIPDQYHFIVNEIGQRIAMARYSNSFA